MKIGAKLIFGFLAVALLIVIVGYIGVNSSSNVQREFNKVSEQTLPAFRAVEDLRLAGLRIVASTSEFGFISAEKQGAAGLAEEKELIKEGKESFDNAFKQYENLVNKFFPDEKEFLENIRNAGQVLKDRSDKVAGLKEKGISGQEVLQAKKEFEDAEQAFLEDINKVIAHETEEYKKRDMEVNDSISGTKSSIIFISAITLLIAIALGFFTSRSISNPITKLTKVINEISTGQLDAEMQGKERNDEIGDLARAFDRTVVSLKLAMKKASKSEQEKEDKKK